MHEDDPRMPHRSAAEIESLADLERLFSDSPIPRADLLENMVVYMPPQVFSLALGLADIYRRILDVHGCVLDLGTRFGRNMVLFSMLRRIYEPYNHFRRIVGFDSFSGLPAGSASDGDDWSERTGWYGSPVGYASHLRDVMDAQERLSPLGHIGRSDVVPGLAQEEVPRYLEDNPETIVALAYFDMDLYEPTRDVLYAILPHTTRGSILVFDELSHPRFPGETLALKEVLGARTCRIQRSPHRAHPAFVVLD